MRVELKRVKLTDRFVKSATTGGRKSPIFMDDEVIGFGVGVRETGRKSFTLEYMFEGRRALIKANLGVLRCSRLRLLQAEPIFSMI